MAKIKIHDFTGIITNVDQSKRSLSDLRWVQNAKVMNGYIEADLYGLQALAKDSKYITDPYNYLPELNEGYQFETGAFVKLSNDPLSRNQNIFVHTYLVLIAKGKLDDQFIRQVWIIKWGDDDAQWRCLDKGASPELTYIDSTFLITNLPGEAFILQGSGVAKIYMPHDSFWLGYIDRNLKVSSNITDTLIYTNRFSPLVSTLYFDRLVEQPTFISSNTEVDGDNNILCAIERRIGLDVDIETIDDDSEVIVESNNNFKFIFRREENWDEDRGTGSTKTVRIYNAIYQGGEKDGESILCPFLSSYPGGSSYEWVFYKYGGVSGNDGTWLIPTDLIKAVEQSGGDIPYKDIKHNPYISNNGQQLNTPYINFYRMTKSQIEDTNYVYILEKGNTEEGGFPSGTKETNIVVTVKYDNVSELIVSHQVISYEGEKAKYGIYGSIKLPLDFNRRLTKIRFYIKNQDLLDYTLVKEIDLLSEDEQLYSRFLILNSDVEGSGVTLSSQIAFAFDEKYKEYYKLLTGLTSVATSKDVSLATKYGDYNNVYFNVLGGGNLQTDIFYIGNILRLTPRGNLVCVVALENNFLVVDTFSSQLIRPDIIETSLIFSPQATIEFGLLHRGQIAEVQGGIVILTEAGVFVTNGYDKKWLSEEINNIIKERYNGNSRIEYNPLLKEIYFYNVNENLSIGGSNGYYRYTFERDKWEFITIGNYYLKEIIVDNEGKLHYLTGLTGTESQVIFAYPSIVVGEPITTEVPTPEDPLTIYIPMAGNVTANTVTIVFATNKPTTGIVYYGTDPGDLNQSESDSTPSLYHQILIDQLQMEQNYYYKIVAFAPSTGETVETETFFFLTGKEVTIQVTNILLSILNQKKVKKNLSIIPSTFGIEILNTIDPDAEVETAIESTSSTFSKVEASIEESIITEYITSVT